MNGGTSVYLLWQVGLDSLELGVGMFDSLELGVVGMQR